MALAPPLKFWQQPLVHFLLLGIALFALERMTLGNEADPHRVVIDDAKYSELAGIHRDATGVDPLDEDMEALTVQWAQNEVLYREAQLMGLDRGDEMIRQRLILKLRNVVFNRIQPPTVDDAALESWFAANRARYDEPARLTIEQFQLAGSEATEATAALLAAELDSEATPARYRQSFRRYVNRPASHLSGLFGEADAAALEDAPLGTWQAVQSPVGWHLARLTAHAPAVAADLDRIRERVREDCKDALIQEQVVAHMSEIAARYDIRLELSDPPSGWDDRSLKAVQLALSE